MTEPIGASPQPIPEIREPDSLPDVPSDPENSRGIAPAGNLSTGRLKLAALFFMIIDHLGVVVFPSVTELRYLGRIAFPIYCWCMVVGFYYTHSVPKYLGRILLTGVLVQPLYAYVMNHVGTTGNLLADLYLPYPNIFLTLFLGLAALWGIRERKWFSHIWAPAAAICLATVLKVDYGWHGVLFIILLYASRGMKRSIAAVMIAYFLYWASMYRVTGSLFGWTIPWNAMPSFLSGPLSAIFRMEGYGLLSLAFILSPFKKNVRLPLWLSYGLYPAHLLVVLAVKLLLKA